MDRNKSTPGTRGPKSKVTQQPPDLFIALGPKQSSSRDVDSKRNVPLAKQSSSISQPSSKAAPERKREGSSSSVQSVPPSKKIKIALPNRPPGVPVPGPTALVSTDRGGNTQQGVEAWENLAIECESSDIFDNVMNYSQAGNTDKAIAYILGAIRTLRAQRFKPCKIVFNSILLLCQCKPTLFNNEHVVTALVSSLRRDIAAGYKTTTKGNVYNQMLFINILMHSFVNIVQWPEAFVKIYVEDAVGDRVWIDNPFCKPFVDNIVTAFGTKQPPKSLLTSEMWAPTGRDSSSPLTVNSLEDEESFNEHRAQVEMWKVKTIPRYTQSQELVEQIVLEAIKEQLTRRQQPETITKNFVRFLSIACGLVEIRVIAASRLETWLHNHKLMKPAQELLAYLCYNCSASTQRDIEVVAQLSKLRLKSKPLVNIFNNCLKEMVISFPENLYPLLKYTIYNELSNARNTNNLVVVGAMFQVTQEASADAFASICLELLLNKDDYLRSLRALLKEINRVLRHDFNLLGVVHALLRDRPELVTVIHDFEFKDRMFLALADLVCMCMLLSISPQVRDAATQSKRDIGVLEAFQTQVSNIQREAVSWLHDSAVRIFRPNAIDFAHVVHKIVLLEQSDHYYKIDNWPGENERNLFLRLASEVPLLQATLIRILLIGISKEHPIGVNEITDIAEQLVRRAGCLVIENVPPLAIDKVEVIDFFFNLCSYTYPDNIILPSSYTPPKMAIASLYWKSWLTLLILAAHNPNTIGSLAWNKYPTLRMLMEMCITNHFSFPPPTMLTGDSTEDFILKETQILALERQRILELETYLAAASTKMEVTEQTSLLISQLIELKPLGDARKPPALMLEQLQHLNTTHRLGHLLCRSRNPDFLLDIMSRQGGTAHMPWLAELVHSSEGAFAHLPVQCLCEYLVSTSQSERLTKHGQLLSHLRTVVSGSDPQIASEVLEYLLRRLTSMHSSNRIQAVKGLTLILAPNEETEISHHSTQWLTQFIPQFPHIQTVRPLLIQFLRQAILVETNPIHVANYLNFLATETVDDPLPDMLELILDLAMLIVERTSVTSFILPGENMQILKVLISIFCIYLQHAREPTDDAFHWSESQDQVMVTWANGEQCTIQILVVHASIILLTYGPIENFEHFNVLLNTWFPANEEPPKAYLVDTSEEALLVPDWLKLRMIRSNVPSLLDAAVDKLEAAQLVLFIQSFGIPIVSVSKLLQTLDKVTVMNTKLVVDSVLDKNYMIQLVEVQNRRGAVGGETFVKALEMQAPILQDDNICDVGENKKELPILPINKSDLNTCDINELLNNVFSNNSNRNKNNNFCSLLKIVSTEPKSSEIIFKILENATTTYIQFFLQSSYCMPFIRVLFIKENMNKLSLSLAKKLLELMESKNNTTELLLKQFISSSNSETIVKMEVEQNELQNSLKKVEGTASLSEKLGKMLLSEKTDTKQRGLIIDWLTTVELEIANVDGQREQMDILFSKHDLPFKPLLMSLILQRASWRTLSGVVAHLLKESDSNYCPVSALDFLTALTHSPRLWQGRDKNIPKHYSSHDVLHINPEQVKVLIEYILKEAEVNDSNWEKNMETRLPLLLKSMDITSATIKDLMEKAQLNKKVQHLLLMLYMSKPCVYHYLNNFDKSQFAVTVYSKTSSNVVDVISHTLISALAATPRMKDWSRKSQDIDLCIKKLTSTHPELVLRQLPMLAGCLRGRAQYEWGVLKSRGHLLLFGQVLGLLELLQPIVFEQKETLCAILDSYFILLQYHGHAKDLTILISRIVTFIQNWMIKDVRSALKYIQQYGHLLNELQLSQPNVRPLLSSVSLPTQESNTPGELLVGAATPHVREPLPQHWPALIAALQSQDIFPALQELDHLTNKKPQLLQNVSQYLFNNLDSPNGSIRSLSFTLIIRLLKCNPKYSSEVLPGILSCLDSKNPDIVTSVLDRLPDLVASMQEDAKLILTRVFQLGINSNMNASSNISKAIAVLSLQSGC